MTCQDNVWYVHRSMLNMCQISSLMAAAEGLVAEFSSFANSEERKRKSNLLMSFPKISNQMGSFGQIRKKIVIPHLSADSRYFLIYALNFTCSEFSTVLTRILLRSNGNRSFRLQVVSPTSRFAYSEVVSPTRPKSFRLQGLSRFAYIKVDSPTLNTYY